LEPALLEQLETLLATTTERDASKREEFLAQLKMKEFIQEEISDYSSIGAFYNRVKILTELFSDRIKTNKQVDDFRRYYADAEHLTINKDGCEGFPQVKELLETIIDQGEGENKASGHVGRKHRNTATDVSPSLDHYGKLLRIRATGSIPPQILLNHSP
jgi:hypothetical protein